MTDQEIIEATARAICRHVHVSMYSAEHWRVGELDRKVDAYWHNHVEAANRLLAICAPAVRERCAEEADRVMEARRKGNPFVEPGYAIRALPLDGLTAAPAESGDYLANSLPLLREAAADSSLSDAAFRSIVLAKHGSLTPELNAWARDVMHAAAPAESKGESLREAFAEDFPNTWGKKIR